MLLTLALATSLKVNEPAITLGGNTIPPLPPSGPAVLRGHAERLLPGVRELLASYKAAVRKLEADGNPRDAKFIDHLKRSIRDTEEWQTKLERAAGAKP